MAVTLSKSIFFLVAHVAMGRSSDLSVGRGGAEVADCTVGSVNSPTCNPARQARTLLQHLTSASGALFSDDGQAPEGITHFTKDHIEQQLIPQAEATTRELQGEVDKAVQKFEACSSALAGEEVTLSTQESTLITAEQRHNECEMKVAQNNRSEEAICGDLTNFVADLTAPADAKEVNGSSPETALVNLGAMNSFYNDVYPTFLEKKKACEVAQNGEEVSKAECDADKKSIEESWCGLKSARTQACTGLNSCWTTTSSSFVHLLEVTKMIEENTKAHVQKYIDECQKNDGCPAGTIDVSNLEVNYPSKPAAMECDDTIKTDWSYASVSCAGDVAESVTIAPSVTAAPAASVTAAPAGNGTL